MLSVASNLLQVLDKLRRLFCLLTRPSTFVRGLQEGGNAGTPAGDSGFLPSLFVVVVRVARKTRR